MATLTGKITDVTSSTPENISSITVKAPSVRIGSGTDVVVSSPAVVDFNRDTGDITISGLTGGLSWLYIEGDGWSDSIALSVAEGMISLVEAIANAAGAPGLVDYVQLLANLKLAVDGVAQDAVDDAAADIAWHQDTPDPSWNIEDFPKGIWKIENATQRERLGLPNSNGVLAMHVFNPDRQSVQNAKAAYWLSLSHVSPTKMLIRSTSNTGVWEPAWRNTYDGYEPPSKRAAVPLTFPRGSSYSDDRPTLTIRIPFKFGAAVKRARLRLRNYDYRSDHGFPGSYRIVGAGIGKHQINDDGSMTGLVPEGESITQLMGSTQMAGPDEAAGGWVDVDLEANTDYLLSYSFTADDGMMYTRQTGQCFTNRLSSGWNRVGSVTSTPSNMSVLAAILDVEVLDDVPIYGYLGDSQTAAISASRPGYDSWAMVHSRLAGAIPTIHGHAGGGLNEWQAASKPAYAISEGMAKFDRFHISMGSNDISGGRPFTGIQEYLTNVMKNWRSQTDTFVLHNYLPRTVDNPTDTVRNALNDWIINELPGDALYAVDIYGTTVDLGTGLMDERWRGSVSDVHMNTAGNARVALATQSGAAGSGGDGEAVGGAVQRAYSARDAAVAASQSAQQDRAQTALDREQTTSDSAAVQATREYVESQIEILDMTFTESIPPYLQPSALSELSPISVASYGARSEESLHAAIVSALSEFPADRDKNRTVYIPAGDYEVEPGFFSNWDFAALGINNTTRTGLRIVGDGKHATRLILKTGGQEAWFYDSFTDNKNLFMDLTFEGISFLTDDPNLGNGFKQWSSGQDKRFRFINCVMRLNTILHTLGTGNADLNRFINTMITANGPAIILENQQSVANGMHNCDVTVRDSFIELRAGGSFWFNNGNLEMHNEGTNTGDHFLIDVPEPTSNGLGNCEFNFTDMRVETHGANKKIARTVDSTGMLQLNFTRATFGTVSGGARDSVDIGSGTRALFRDCVLNESLNFIARSGWSNSPSGAVIVFDACDVGRASSLWTRCTTVGNQARIIANDCFRQSSGTNNPYKHPQDFDFGWRTAPAYAPQPQTKIVNLKNTSQGLPWPGDEASAPRATLPEGSYVKKVHVHKPVTIGVSGDYQLHVGSTDKSVIYGSSDMLGYGEEISLTIHDVGTVHETGIAVWATGTPSSRFSGGPNAVAYAEYI